VQDSLAQGVSLYMAQLQRLKQIVEAARATPEGELTFYMLDEILSGTNSADRTAGVRAVMHHLLGTRSIGVLATHDLALATDPQLQRSATFIHFTDSFDATTGTMSFDYRIRPGPVRTSNALELMRMLGLPVE
jgi:DNA mismatch repair ATPase MutS